MDTDQTFHTPCFGDEDFGIPLSISNSSQQNQNMFAYNMGSTNNPNNQVTTHHYVIYDQNQMGDLNPVQVQSLPQHQEIHPQHQTVIVNSGYSGIPINSSESIPQIIQQPHAQQQEPFPKKVTVKAPRKSPVKKKVVVQASDESEDEQAETKKVSPAKSPKGKGKKAKKDPNEPIRPVSAYAHFFRDTQAAIKGQNPNSTFGEVSKIVAAMWEALDPEHKNVYKKKAETAKRQYMDDLAVYKASILAQDDEDVQEVKVTKAKTPRKPAKSPSPPKKPVQKGQPRNSKKMDPKLNILPTSPGPVKVPQVRKSPVQKKQATVTQTQPMVEQSSQNEVTNSSETNSMVVNICIRHGCQNLAITSSEWDDEYCSNECVVTHCKDVFQRFVLELKSSV